MSMQDDQARRDERALTRFMDEAKEMLTERRLVKDGLQVSFTTNWHYEQGFEFSGSEHDWEDVLAYLPSLRRFLIPKDDLFVGKVRTIIRRHLTDSKLVSDLDEIGAEWDSGKWAPAMTMMVQFPDGTELSVGPQEAFDLYLDAKVAHVDLAKAEKLEKLRQGIPPPMMQFFVLDGIVEASKYINFLINTVLFAKANGHWSDEIVDLRG